MPKQLSRNNAPLVNYAYLADGTKYKAQGADGDGFVYTGSLRWRLGEDELLPESVAITGGRAVCDSTDTWAANYYICDHLGSVRTVTDGNGTVLANYDYLPYGTDMLRDVAAADVTDYRFTGKEVQRDFGANLYDSFARFQHNNGRFLSIDPKAESFYHISPYAYCAGNPVNLVDPDGEKPRIYIQGGGVGHVFLSVGDGRNIIIYSYGRYGTLHEFLGRTWGSANPTGEGVMYKYEGEEAYEFLNEHKAEIMAVFEVNSNDDYRIMSYYDAQLDPNKRPTNKSKKSYYDKNAYVIDAYHIIKNNCVKKTLKGINLVNSYIDGDYIMPASLHYALIQKTRENGSYITEISINDILNYGINE